MDLRTRLYIVLVVTVATILIVVQFPLSELESLTTEDWRLIGSLLAVALLAQGAAIDFGRGRQASSSVAFVPFLATAILFPPPVAMFLAGSTIAILEPFTKRALAKKAFNVAQITVAIGVSAHLYTFILGDAPRAE